VTTLTVRGDAVFPAQPDEVVLRVLLSAVRSTPREAMDDVARRSEVLQNLLQDLQIDPASRSTTDINLGEKREYLGGTHHHRGYEASTTVSIRLEADQETPQLIARLVGEAVSQTDAHLEGPWWRIHRQNDAWSHARTEAARDARKKAEDLAAALDIRLGPIVEIREPGTYRPQGDRHLRFAASSAEPFADADPSLHVEAGELDVYAAVEVTFGLEPG
jgi:uncharacterized protein YggE